MKIKNKNILVFLLVFSFLFSSMSFAAKIKIEYANGMDKFLEDLYEIKLDGEDRLYFDIGGADLYFVEDLDNIYISDELDFNKRGNRVRIFTPRKSFFDLFDRNHKIVVGTKNRYRLIDINSGGINLSGVLYVDKIKINAGGVNMDGEYYSQEITINGAGINLKGFIKGDFLKINGAGMDIDLDITGLNELRLNGAGINAKLKYLDGWVGTREISVNGLGGDIDVMVPANNNLDQDGHLGIDTNGFIDIDVEYY